MMKSSCIKALPVVCAVGALSLGSVASAAPYLSVDFQSDTVGAAPAGTYTNSGYPPNTAIVVDSTSTGNVDPFGGVGNQSLFTEDDDTGVDVRVAYAGGAPGVTAGTFSIKLYLESTAGSTEPYTNIRLGTAGASTTGTTATTIYFNHHSYLNQIIMEADGGLVTLDNAIAVNTVYDLEINFDSDTDTFSGTINGNALTSDGGTKTSWSYATDLSAIDSVLLNTGTISWENNRVYYDDIVIDVPEPGSMGLIAMGLLVMFRRRR